MKKSILALFLFGLVCVEEASAALPVIDRTELDKAIAAFIKVGKELGVLK